MKTLQEQYNLIKEGKGDKNFFLKQARHLFPNYINQYTDYNNAVTILKGKQVLNESIGDIPTSAKSIFQTFKENVGRDMDMDKIYKVFNYFKDKSYDFTQNVKPIMNKMGMNPDEQQEVEVMLFDYEREDEIDEILAEIIGVKNKKEYGDQNEFDKIEKEVQDDLNNQYNNKDKKDIDNVYGTSFLNGYYAEMKDPKNSKKTPDELKQIVLKNMVKDINYYAKNAMFGTKGVGFETSTETIAPKGKYKSSGYGDLKESVMYGDSDGDYDDEMKTTIQANEYYDKGLEAYSEGDFLKAERYYKAALKAGSWLGWTEYDLPPYKSLK